MGMVKEYWARVAMREYGEITPETLDKAKPIAQAEISGQVALAGFCPKCGCHWVTHDGDGACVVD